MEIETLSLQPVFDVNIKGYVIKDFEKSKQEIVSFIKDLKVKAKIKDEATYKEAKEKRAELNKGSKLVNSVRIGVKKLITADIENQCKELDALLTDAVSIVKDNIAKYESATKPIVEGIPVYGIVITSTDKEALAKIKTYALKQKANVKEIK